jgi:hypothetical protein
MPCEFVALIVAFASLFSKPVFQPPQRGPSQVLMLWAKWKTLSGSYVRLTPINRGRFSA